MSFVSGGRCVRTYLCGFPFPHSSFFILHLTITLSTITATHEFIAILDFGSQYAQLIARRVRERKVYCEILPCTIPAADLAARKPKGIILSGGPASVYAENAPACSREILAMGVPVLGICYGMQLGCMMLGCEVSPATGRREYGRAEATLAGASELFAGLPDTLEVWASHGDHVSLVSGDFDVLASTPNCPNAAVKHRGSAFYGVQFHPEVVHTPLGGTIIENFLYRICGCSGDWTMQSFIDFAVQEIRERVGPTACAVCGVSGGVDSSVTAAITHRALGNRLTCIFVDNGVLRKGEFESVVKAFSGQFNIHLLPIDATDDFLGALAGRVDPEDKRKTIGRVFIEVFEREARKLRNIKFLAQGTIYPDVIESRSPLGGPSATIKSHHNVGGLPEKLGLGIVEPLRFLFKDEVRQLGRELGLPDQILKRHPFPGPGLAVRMIGEVTRERLEVLRNADAILIEELHASGQYDKVAQAFAVLLPVSSVGVMGDERTYENVIAVRCVNTSDFMTADWSRLPQELLARISNRIINEVRGVNRVVYDISSKPPATIEWE